MKIKRRNLTLQRIAEAVCEPGKKQVFLWDAVMPRLALRVTDNGSKSFIYEGKLNRKTIRWTIGAATTWTIESARVEAGRLQGLVDRGIDPRELEQKKEAAKQQAQAAVEAKEQEIKRDQQYTLFALLDAYVAHLNDQGKERSSKSAESVFRVHVLKAHPDLADKPAKHITSDDMARVIRCPIESGKERTAGLLRSYLFAAFSAALRGRYDARLPEVFKEFGVKTNPLLPIPTIPGKPRTRTLSKDELRLYLANLGNAPVDRILKLALFAGGQRMSPLLRSEVKDFDPDNGTLRLWDTKGRRNTPREHILPLGPVALGIVATLAATAKGQRETSLFFSRGGTIVHATNPGKRVSEISTQMGGDPFNLLDIRRTAETMLAGLGVSKDIRAQLLSHGLSGVQEKHYDFHQYMQEKRAALLLWEDFLTSLTGGSNGMGKVIPIRRIAH